MSFGKRGVETPSGKKLSNGPIEREPQQIGNRDRIFESKLIQQLRTIATFFAVLLGGNYVLGSGINKYVLGNPVTGMVDPRSVEGRKLQQASIDAALAARPGDVRQLEIHVDDLCMPKNAQTWRTPPDKVEYWVDSPTYWAVDAEDPRGQLLLTDVPAYLHCVAGTERQRFCQPYFEKKFANQIKRYFAARAEANRELARLAEFQKRGLVKKTSEADIDPKSEISSNFAFGLDPQITASVRDLSRNGFLTKESFGSGWFRRSVPEEIVDFIEVPQRRSCQ